MGDRARLTMAKTSVSQIVSKAQLEEIDRKLRDYYQNPLNKKLSVNGQESNTVLVSTGWHKDLGH